MRTLGPLRLSPETGNWFITILRQLNSPCDQVPARPNNLDVQEQADFRAGSIDLTPTYFLGDVIDRAFRWHE